MYELCINFYNMMTQYVSPKILIPMIFTFCLIGILFIITCVIYYIRAKKLNIKGPNHYPIIGSLIEFIQNRHRFYDWLLECSKKYKNEKGIIYFSIPICQPFILLLKPSHVEHITNKNSENYVKEPMHKILYELLGNGIFNTDGMNWKNQRKISSHMFSTKKLSDKAFIEFNKSADMLCNIIDKHIENDEEFDFKDLMFRLTMDTICEIAFGYDANCLNSSEMPEFAKAIDRCTNFLFYRFNNPLWCIKQFVGTPDEMDFSQDIKLINELCYKILNERLEKYNNGETIGDDILSLFINKGYTDNEYLRDIIFSFVIAGRDTTASSLTWMMYELLKNKNIYDKICDEISDVESDNINKINNLKYTEYAFKESLRLHPPVPLDVKYSVQDDVIDNVKIPKNSIVMYAPYIFGRMQEIWGNDYEMYNPDRWYNFDGNQYKFISFNAGKRICLGRFFAILEAKVIMTKILNKYNFECDTKFNPGKSLGLTSTMDNKFMVKAKHK